MVELFVQRGSIELGDEVERSFELVLQLFLLRPRSLGRAVADRGDRLPARGFAPRRRRRRLLFEALQRPVTSELGPGKDAQHDVVPRRSRCLRHHRAPG
jgi:hypothetical protein